MSDGHLPLLPLVLGQTPPGLATALAQEGIPCRPLVAGPPQGRFLLFDGRKPRPPQPAAGQVAIDVRHLASGRGGELLDSLSDRQSRRCQWSVDGLTLEEEIARVDKWAIRRQVLDSLRAKIEQSGGIWLAVSAYPFPYRSAFNFRIDYDQYDAADFSRLLQALSGHEQAASHFVNAEAYETAADALRRLRGLDVGSHGYRHHTYRTEEENLRNIRRGIEVLDRAGLEPRGFVAPLGRFNQGLLAALETLHIPYSSEFALAYDDVPFFPEGSDVLQVPIHPVCLGLFLDAVRRGTDSPATARRAMETAVDLAIGYFDRVARAKYQAGQSVFLYGHPTARLGRYPRLLQSVFATVSTWSGIWRTTMSEFSAWWRARGQVRLTVQKSHLGYSLSARRKPPGWRVGLEYWRGEHMALLPLDRPHMSFSPEAVAFQRRKSSGIPRPVRIDRPEGIRGHVRRLLDWELETPVEEIDTATWRNWAKRTLRQFWRA